MPIYCHGSARVCCTRFVLISLVLNRACGR